MKVNFKMYLKPESEFQIDADPSETIGDLKVKIKDSQGHEVEEQKIIYLGKGLDDDMTLESCRVSEKGFLLLSLVKPIEDLPWLEELGAIEYFSLTEEQIAERLRTIPVSKICAGIPPLSAESDSSSKDAATSSEHFPTVTDFSAFKDEPLFSSLFDSEFDTKNLPPVTTVAPFRYRTLSELLHGPRDTPASTSVPPTTTTTTPVPPATTTSTFNPRPFSSSLFDSDDTTHFPPVTTASTFRYRPLSEILADPSNSSTPTADPPTTTSTFKPRPFTSSSFDSDSTSKHYPPVTTVSTFRYRPLSEILADSSNASSSTTVPSTTTASSSNHRPITSSLLDSDGTSKHYPPVTTVSTFRYRPLSEILADSSNTPAPTAVPTTTTVSATNYRPFSSSLLDSDSTSRHYPPVTTVSTFRYRPLSEILGSTTPGDTTTSTPVPPTATTSTSDYRSMSSSAASTSAQIPPIVSNSTGNASGRHANPQIAQFRRLISQNPELRQHFIQQISQEHPEMGQMFTQNPDLLSQFLDRMENEGVGSGPQVTTLSVTAAEKEAIDRLEGLGFPRQAVIEAYFTCDKNEELAANYLLENA